MDRLEPVEEDLYGDYVPSESAINYLLNLQQRGLVSNKLLDGIRMGKVDEAVESSFSHSSSDDEYFTAETYTSDHDDDEVFSEVLEGPSNSFIVPSEKLFAKPTEQPHRKALCWSQQSRLLLPT